MRLRGRTVAVAAALALALGGAAPVHADEPDIPDDLPALSTPEAEDFEAEAEELPADMVEAIERDLGIDAPTYLAQSEAAVEGAELVAALEEAGVEVTGSEIEGTEFTVYLADADGIPAVESAGARAELRERAPSTFDIEIEAYDDLYGGSPWGYQVSASSFLTCSIGLAGYNASGDDIVATAGHCFGVDAGDPLDVDSYSGRVADPRSASITVPRQFGGALTWTSPIGTLVSGSKEFGNGYDAALLATEGSTAIARPQVARWGSTSTEDGQGGPLASPALALTGATAGTVGAGICKSGYRTGWTCGTIEAVDQMVSVSGLPVNGIRSTACMLPGDSGGVAVIGTAAAGINSGGGFDENVGDGYCKYNDGNDFSFFFHVVDPSPGDGDDLSLTQKYGSSWTLCTGPTPFVTGTAPGGTPGAAAPLTGKLPCALAETATTVGLYLDGSPTAFGTTSPSGTGGSWSFNLDSLPAGSYEYEVRASWGSTESAGVVGGFDIVPSLPVLSGSPGGWVEDPAPLQGTLEGMVAGVTVELYLDGAGSPSATASPSGANGAWSFPTSALGVGDHEYVVAANAGAAPIGQITGSFSIVENPPVDTLPSRIAGEDRYATAAAVAGEWDELFDAEVVFVATGEKYPDALSAAAAAVHRGAPVLLTKKDSLPSVTKTRLNSLRPDTIVVLGSTATISSQVFNALKSVSGSPTVTRWYGPDRYATGREIVKRVWGVDGDGDGAEDVDIDSVVIATGRNFPDALSAAPAVASVGGAVILVDGSSSTVPSATLKLIRDLEPAHIVIAGSSAAVSSDIASQLKSAFPGKVTRKYGSDRYATSVAITDYFFNDADAVFFAVGTKFPDALSGAALAGAVNAPLIVTQKSCVSSSTRNLVNSLAPAKKVLLGSSASISGNVAKLKVC